MPVYNGAGVLASSLLPLLEMRRAGEVAEVIVVDDGSTDRSVAVATALGVVPISSGGRLGPGGARNVAASVASGDVLWFVDADVVVHADAARRVATALSTTRAAAVFGCYDERPAGQNFLSQYKNLVHRYYHDREPGEAATFWAGCGAVRKDVFLASGGFDAARYPLSVDRRHRARVPAARARLRDRARPGNPGDAPQGVAAREPSAHGHRSPRASLVAVDTASAPACPMR